MCGSEAPQDGIYTADIFTQKPSNCSAKILNRFKPARPREPSEMSVGLGNSNAYVFRNMECRNRPDIGKGLQFPYWVSKDLFFYVLK